MSVPDVSSTTGGIESTAGTAASAADVDIAQKPTRYVNIVNIQEGFV